MGPGRRRCVTEMDQREDDLAAGCVLHGRERTTQLADGGTIALVCTGVPVGMDIPVGLGIQVSMDILMDIPEGILVTTNILRGVDIPTDMGILVSTCSSWLRLASLLLPLLCQSRSTLSAVGHRV